MFSVEVPLAPMPDGPAADKATGAKAEPHGVPRTGKILLVEDDPDIRTLLTAFLEDLGHRVIAAEDSNAALTEIAHIALRPDLVLADYNLPNGPNGLELGKLLRKRLGASLPVLIMTGDISKETLANVAAAQFVQLNKPMRLDDLTSLIEQLLPPSGLPGQQDGTVFIVDDDPSVRTGIAALLTHQGRRCVVFDSCEAFIEAYRPGSGQCLLLDAHLPGMDGLDLLRQMRDGGQHLPSIMMTGDGDVGMAVEAMKAGAADFIEKPVASADLLACIDRVLNQAQGSASRQEWEREAASKLATLTARQREVMTMVLEGHPSKNIAADLRISQRTVENHRAAIMHKTGSSSLPALARLAIAAARGPALPDPA